MEYSDLDDSIKRQLNIIETYSGKYEMTNALNCLRAVIIEIDTEAIILNKSIEKITYNNLSFSLRNIRNSLCHNSFTSGIGVRQYQDSYVKQIVGDNRLISKIKISMGDSNCPVSLYLESIEEIKDLISVIYDLFKNPN